jgi:putative transcriptional regulator
VARAVRDGPRHNGPVTPERTTGQLLVSTPQLSDGIFARSVVLVLHHDDDGAHGVVLNRPLPAKVSSVLPGWDRVLSTPDALFQGGPVQTDSALGLAAVPGVGDGVVGVQRLFGAVAVVDLDTPPELLDGHLAGMRVFAGYAGWSAGQLDNEIRRGDWYVVELEAGDLFGHEPSGLWRRVLRRQRGALRLVASYPEDVTLN